MLIVNATGEQITFCDQFGNFKIALPAQIPSPQLHMVKHVPNFAVSPPIRGYARVLTYMPDPVEDILYVVTAEVLLAVNEIFPDRKDFITVANPVFKLPEHTIIGYQGVALLAST